MLVLCVWTTVNSQQQRNSGAFDVTDRISQQPLTCVPSLLLKLDLFSDAEIEFSKQSIVLLRELAQRVSFPNVNLACFRISA